MNLTEFTYLLFSCRVLEVCKKIIVNIVFLRYQVTHPTHFPRTFRLQSSNFFAKSTFLFPISREHIFRILLSLTEIVKDLNSLVYILLGHLITENEISL